MKTQEKKLKTQELKTMFEFPRFVYPYTKEHKWSFIWTMFFVLIGCYTAIEVPLYIGQIINQFDSGITANDVWFAFGILFILSFIDYIAQLGMRFTGVRFQRDVMESIRRDIFSKLHKQEMEYYSKESVGQLMERTVDEVYQFQEILAWGVRIIATIIIVSAIVIVIMFNTSPILAIVFALTYPILLYVLNKTSRKNAQMFYDARLKFGLLSDTMAENLSGIKTVKSFGREKEQVDAFKERNTDYIDKSLELVSVKSFLQPGMIALYSIAVVTFLASGGFFLGSGLISAGVFASFMLLILRLGQQTRFLGDLGIDLLMSDSSAIRLNEVMQAKLVLEDDPNAEIITELKGQIEFKNVSFTYPGTSYKALDNINLIIKPGEKVALLGPTGAGKTTLVNLIPRFYDPSEGSVLLDGRDIRHVSRKSIRNFIQVVHQDNFLYTITLYENISFGKPNADLEEVIHFAEASQIHSYINSLDKKYDTIVGERGVTLSGGQRQRTTIARGLLVKPKIIIFDDSVSAIDPETEAKIQETIATLDKDSTLIVISQRPSSLKFVDRIIVLEDGAIIQQGTHAELMEVDGLYRRFINSVKKQVKFIDWDQSISESTLTENLPPENVPSENIVAQSK